MRGGGSGGGGGCGGVFLGSVAVLFSIVASVGGLGSCPHVRGCGDFPGWVWVLLGGVTKLLGVAAGLVASEVAVSLVSGRS